MAEVPKYEDPRVLQASDEIAKHAVAIVPLYGDEDDLQPDLGSQGSGTCINIGGRFFIATAAHVIKGYPKKHYMVVTAETSCDVLRLIGGGFRSDEFDVGWLELHPRAAAASGRHFLDLQRLAPFRTGENDALVVFGAPMAEQTQGTHQGLPRFTATAMMREVGYLSAETVAQDPHRPELYLDWRDPHGTPDTPDYPAPYGVSGGGVWALNPADRWLPSCIQLVGIEFSQRNGGGHRFLVGQQMQVWLEMVAEDIPELSESILQFLNGSRFAIKPSSSR